MAIEGLLYTQQHEWAKIEADTATVGITDYAQQMLGEVTFVELPSIGKEVKSKEELGVVESSKAASDVYSPVTGKVTEINTRLESNPELINDDCYNTGWICKLEITDTNSLQALMDARQYDEYLKSVE
ncbi:MAG: glycine cleavage system protein GcvH [Sedimentisphaerales bacterium]|nr:glycine cleavage system protein GcvH [Sedimentisphaerales bacterium]